MNKQDYSTTILDDNGTIIFGLIHTVKGQLVEIESSNSGVSPVYNVTATLLDQDGKNTGNTDIDASVDLYGEALEQFIEYLQGTGKEGFRIVIEISAKITEEIAQKLIERLNRDGFIDSWTIAKKTLNGGKSVTFVVD